MKRQISLLYLPARHSLQWVVMILGVMAVIQLGVAYGTLRADSAIDLETLLDGRFFRWAGGIALTGVVATVTYLCSGSGIYYTMERLPVPKWTIKWWFVLYGVLVMLLCWAVQLLVVLLVCVGYQHMAAIEMIHTQTVLIASYFSYYFHRLMPLADTVSLVSTVVLYLCLGIGSGLGAVSVWYGKRPIGILIVALCTGFEFGSIGSDVLGKALSGLAFCLVFMMAAKLTEMRGEGKT